MIMQFESHADLVPRLGAGGRLSSMIKQVKITAKKMLYGSDRFDAAKLRLYTHL